MMAPLVQPTRILIVGNGGREHALAWKLAAEPGVNDVFVTMAKTAMLALPHVHGAGASPVSPDSVVRVARQAAVELVVIGPEAPLAASVADALRGIVGENLERIEKKLPVST